MKLVFVGDSITDFWLLGDDPWIPGRMHGRRVWDESFAGAVPQNHVLNIGISGDRTEHLLFRILPKTQGGLGELDAAALAPEFFVLMVGINNSYAPEAPVADSVYEGVLAVMRSLHARKPATRLLLQSILPTAEPSRDDTVVRPVNARLAALAKSPELTTLHLWQPARRPLINLLGKLFRQAEPLLTVAASVFYTPGKHKNHEQDTSIALKQLNSRSHVMAASLGGALALCAAQALAALGREPTVPVPFSASSTPAARGLAAASVARSGLYTSHPLQLENGTLVQEYATPAGL
ncbi:MAG: GDSL-type esterase/lipase family protein, partial [Rhodoferax sp.]